MFAVKPAITSSAFNAVFTTCADVRKLELVHLIDCDVKDVESLFIIHVSKT